MLDISEGSLRHVVIEALIGDPFATIVGDAEARKADLIVLGEPGKQLFAADVAGAQSFHERALAISPGFLEGSQSSARERK